MTHQYASNALKKKKFRTSPPIVTALSSPHNTTTRLSFPILVTQICSSSLEAFDFCLSSEQHSKFLLNHRGGARCEEEDDEKLHHTATTSARSILALQSQFCFHTLVNSSNQNRKQEATLETDF